MSDQSTHGDSRTQVVDVNGIYKWLIGALTTLLIFGGTWYVNSIQANQKAQEDRLYVHEQRITTLEESKRNTEQLLIDIKVTLDRVRDAVVTKRD